MVAITLSGQPITCDGCHKPFANDDAVDAALVAPAPAYIYGAEVVYLVCAPAPGELSSCLLAARAVDEAWWQRFGCGNTDCRGCASPPPAGAREPYPSHARRSPTLVPTEALAGVESLPELDTSVHGSLILIVNRHHP